MKYKYIGTEEQLKEHGFEMDHTVTLIHGSKYIDFTHSLYVVLSWGNFTNYEVRIIEWNFYDCDVEFTPYIQDLIDANLVEVIA